MDIYEVLNLIDNKLEVLNFTKKISLRDALGQVLATDIVATKDLPAFDNSAMDGYAFRYEDLHSKKIKVLGTIFAGDMTLYEIKENESYKIMTGAMMPKGSDTIIEIENSEVVGGFLQINKEVKKDNAHRQRGEEIKSGEIILKKGDKLTPSKLMLLASQGVDEIEVKELPKIAIYSTGNEIVEPWQSALEYQIYNSNSTGIYHLLKQSGFNATYRGIIKDDIESIKKALNNDESITITSGGASVGEADYMQEALKELGYSKFFDGIAVRPGRPTKIYRKNNKYIIVLPGNPMAAYLIAFAVIIPFLKKLSGCSDIFWTKFRAKATENISLKPTRSNLVLGVLKDGKFTTINGNKFGSGMIKPIVMANALYLSPIGKNGYFIDEDLEVLSIY